MFSKIHKKLDYIRRCLGDINEEQQVAAFENEQVLREIVNSKQNFWFRTMGSSQEYNVTLSVPDSSKPEQADLLVSVKFEGGYIILSGINKEYHDERLDKFYNIRVRLDSITTIGYAYGTVNNPSI